MATKNRAEQMRRDSEWVSQMDPCLYFRVKPSVPDMRPPTQAGEKNRVSTEALREMYNPSK